jgi:hypothetical protein
MTSSPHHDPCRETSVASFADLDAQRAELLKAHSGWRIWYVPNAVDGSVTWCAQREPTIHAYSPEDLDKDISLADAELASEAQGGTAAP